MDSNGISLHAKIELNSKLGLRVTAHVMENNIKSILHLFCPFNVMILLFI